MSDLNLTLNVTDYSGIYYDPNQYTFFGFMGITAALVFCNLGSAYGTARAGFPPPLSPSFSGTPKVSPLMAPPAPVAAMATASPAAPTGPTTLTTATSISLPVFAAVSPPSLLVSASVSLVTLVSVPTLRRTSTSV